mmetsp:Transcript_11008/g.23268  ORF Transcript_11008/g.23268 Transcript_11008/m.23268 type:complete len:197 (-) Transcript_11008:46-636(-)
MDTTVCQRHPCLPCCHSFPSRVEERLAVGGCGLTEDKDKDWAATTLIADACSNIQSMNMTTPAASLVVITSIPDNQSVLTSDSGPCTTTPTKATPPRPSAASQADTRRAQFRIIFSTFDATTDLIKLPILTDTAEEIAATDNASTRISHLSNAIENLLDIVSTERDFISRNVRWPSNLSALSKGLIAQGLFRTQLT